MKPKANTGILVVHGIGEQPRRDTLIRFGQPIIDWLTLHIQEIKYEVAGSKAARSGRVEVTHPGFPDHAEGNNTPESIVVDIVQNSEAGGNAGPTHERWILAETWWADVFDKPAFGSLARWIFLVGPWITLSHVARRDRIEGRPLWFTLPRLVLALATAFVVQVITLVLSIAALIPVPKLRWTLTGILSILTATLGDAYVLVSSPVQRAAAVRKVLDGIDWLNERCEHVVVVAHSQGAAIGAEAVSRCGYGKVSKLITFGSGLSKLQLLSEIYQQEQVHGFNQGRWQLSSQVHLARYTTPVFFLLLIFLPKIIPELPIVDVSSVWPFKHFESPDFVSVINWLPAAVVGTYLIMFLAILLSSAFDKNEGYNNRIKGIHSLITSSTRWLNIYSTHDPVPNGRLGLDDGRNFRQLKVTNRRSLLQDHTSYWENIDEFVTHIVREIDTAGNNVITHIGDGDDLSAAALEGIANDRKKRVFRLVLHRMLLWPSFLVIAWNMSTDLHTLGDSLLMSIRETGSFEWVGTLLQWIGSLVGSILTFYGAQNEWVLGAGPMALGFLLVALVCYLWNLFYLNIWLEFDENQSRISVPYNIAYLDPTAAEGLSKRLKAKTNNALNLMTFLTLLPAALAVAHIYTDTYLEAWVAFFKAGLYGVYFLGILMFLAFCSIPIIVPYQLWQGARAKKQQDPENHD